MQITITNTHTKVTTTIGADKVADFFNDNGVATVKVNRDQHKAWACFSDLREVREIGEKGGFITRMIAELTAAVDQKDNTALFLISATLRDYRKVSTIKGELFGYSWEVAK